MIDEDKPLPTNIIDGAKILHERIGHKPMSMDDKLERALQDVAEDNLIVYQTDEEFWESFDTYKIIRFHFKNENEVIKTGLTLEEAQEHCDREDTHGDGWFDGWTKE